MLKLNWILTLLLIFGGAAKAADPTYWCVRGDGQECTKAELADPVTYRQVAVFSTGFAESEEEVFKSAFLDFIASTTQIPDAVYSSHYMSRMLYIALWMPGGPLGSDTATFGGKVMQHPIRGKALTLRQDEVYAAVDTFRQLALPELAPWGAMVLFNTFEGNITANAAPPGFVGRKFGVAKCTRSDIAGHYVPMHELAHASLNYVDEYTEAGFQNMSIGTLDYLTPFAVTGQNWGSWTTSISNFFGVYDYKISEILAANGNDNVDTTRYPSRVPTAGYSPDQYAYEGGMFFGIGTFHHSGKNIMNSNAFSHGSDDGFDFAHSASQQQVIDQAFDHPNVAGRPNDRLRNAGPHTAWPASWGRSTHVMLYDGDKNHHYHPTRSYDVQVGWYERHWKVCWAAIFPYPCHTDTWVTAQTRVTPAHRTLALKTSNLYGLAGAVQKILCGLGVREIKTGGGVFDLCTLTLDQMTGAFLPTLEFPLPYQDVTVPTTQWLTTYHWRFRADNGTYRSGYTGWSPFFRFL